MAIFTHPEFDGHELVAFHRDVRSGLSAIIAVHNSNLGKALGGCRMWPYASEAEAITDVLRLSRGMTYKAALANLPQGGGKSVIIGDPRRDKTPQMMRAMGQFVESLAGRYSIAEDSGTSVADIHEMAAVTRYVGGLADARAQAEGRTGDPSPATAYGVFVGLKAAVRHRLGRDDLADLHVAIQGVGNVGYRLARHLHEAGARLTVTDIHAPHVQRCVDEFGAVSVGMDEIYAVDAEVFAPCALGAILNDTTIPQLRPRIVAGAANNQLARPAHDAELKARGVLYAPDYVINAGGIIDIYYEGEAYRWDTARQHLDRIGDTLRTIFERAELESGATGAIADLLAEERFKRV